MRIILALLALSLSLPALAQNRPFTFTFDGVVTGTPRDGAIQFDPNSSDAHPWTNPALPAYPVGNGDALQIVFKGFLPAFETLPNQPADGIYRAAVRGVQTFGDVTVASINSIIVGMIGGSHNSVDAPLFLSGFDIIFNKNTNEYSIDVGPNDGFNMSSFNISSFALPEYELSADGKTVTTNGNTFDGNNESGSFAVGTDNSITFSGSSIGQAGQPGGFQVGRQGTLGVSGKFSLPTYQAPADVPEPDMLILFGMGAAGLAWGRRQRTAA